MQPYDIYELMIPPNTKAEMIIEEIEKGEPNLSLNLKMQLNPF